MWQQPLSRGDLLVGLALERGEALSAREIARRTGLSERQVVRCRKRLVEAGELVVMEPAAGCRPARYMRKSEVYYDR